MLCGQALRQQRWHAWADSDTLLPHTSSVTGPRREALVLSSRGFPAGSQRCVLGKLLLGTQLLVTLVSGTAPMGTACRCCTALVND